MVWYNSRPFRTVDEEGVVVPVHPKDLYLNPEIHAMVARFGDRVTGQLARLYKEGKVESGKVCSYFLNATTGPRYLFFFPVPIPEGKTVRYNCVIDGLRDLAAMANGLHLESLAIPHLAMAQDQEQVSWDLVELLVEDGMKLFSGEVTLYTPMTKDTEDVVGSVKVPEAEELAPVEEYDSMASRVCMPWEVE